MKATLAFVAVLIWATSALAITSPTVDWIRQTVPNVDSWWSVSADRTDGVYATGVVYSKPGNPIPGSPDAVLSKFSATGVVQWTRVLATPGWDHGYGVTSDGLGNVYVTGTTSGSLGGANLGNNDAFLFKFDSMGNLLWQRQLGSDRTDDSYGIASDNLGNVYITGRTLGNIDGPNLGGIDAYVTKFDAAGSLQWSRQLGTTAVDNAYSVSVDGDGNVFICGDTNGALGGMHAGGDDAFLSKYDSNGNKQWTRQLGTNAQDIGWAVSADALGNVFVAGHTDGIFDGASAGGRDAFVSKFDSAGGLQWTNQFGSASTDVAVGLSTDGRGNVFVTGETRGSLGGQYNGNGDIFLRKLSGSGSVEWTRQLGTGGVEAGLGVSFDGHRTIYVGGYSQGSLTNNSPAGMAFVAKLVEIPEPNCVTLTGIVGAALICFATRRIRLAKMRFAFTGDAKGDIISVRVASFTFC